MSDRVKNIMESPLGFLDVEISKEAIYHYNQELLEHLLKDHTTGKNIIWATSDYEQYGLGYQEDDEIQCKYIVGSRSRLIQPRVGKTADTQSGRTRKKAEVFTPSWICNAQNNLVDEQWFGRKDVFNISDGTSWYTIPEEITFPHDEEHSWEKYVLAPRLEITCGEAPYLVSRYDSVTGERIPIKNRIGFLDRKLRIINEHTSSEEAWLRHTRKAYQSTYGFEFQGDNLLIARINLLSTFVEYYQDKFKKIPTDWWIKTIADIITWNIWQMDGLKCVVPMSCKNEYYEEYTLFGTVIHSEECYGCQHNDMTKHNGLYCKIRDWSGNRIKEFTYLSLLRGEQA